MKAALVLAFVVLGLILTNGPQGNAHSGEKQPKEQKVQKLFDSMRGGKYAEIEFPRLDLTDVPALLEYADSTKTLKSFPRNPLSSQLETECSEGIVALWLIEGVRHGNKFPSLNALCFKGRVEGTDWTKASEANHKEVAKAYRAWWEKTKDLPPEKARNIDPLQGTGLNWYGSSEAKVRLLFSDKVVKPAPDMPKEARQQERIVPGAKPKTFSKLVEGNISSVTVTYFDQQILKEKKDTEALLRQLLTTPKGTTYDDVPWAKLLGVPTVAATVEHTQGKTGVWLIWKSSRQVLCAYKDGQERWWFGLWLDLEMPR